MPSKMKMTLKNEDTKSTTSTTLPEKNLLMTSQLDRHGETDPKPEMLSAV